MADEQNHGLVITGLGLTSEDDYALAQMAKVEMMMQDIGAIATDLRMLGYTVKAGIFYMRDGCTPYAEAVREVVIKAPQPAT